jgi:hypothetical protein
MYVKVIGPQTELIDVGTHVTWGTHIIQDGRTELGDVDWYTELQWPKHVPGRLHVRGTTGPDGESKGQSWWRFRWVQWRENGDISALVVNAPLFILGDNGKTIDRV